MHNEIKSIGIKIQQHKEINALERYGGGKEIWLATDKQQRQHAIPTVKLRRLRITAGTACEWRDPLVAIFPLIESAHRERGNVKIMKLFGLGKNHYGK